MRGARFIESRSLALHTAVARRLLENPALWDRARLRVASWRAEASRHPYFLNAWEGLLEAPLQQVLDAIVDPGERGQRLRRSSPFAFVLSSRQRWAVWRSTAREEGNVQAFDRS